ncbi:MAG: AMP-binding protein, partial [Myxococcota bacterium]
MGPHSAIHTFVDLLHRRATTTPDRRAYTFLADGDGSGETQTCAEVWARAGGVARALADVPPGTRVALIVDEGHAFHAALYGCMLARVLAVPLHPPDPARPDRTLPRIVQVCAQADVQVLLSHGSHPTRLAGAWPGPPPRLLDIDQLGSDATFTPPEVRPADIAYLQYTSGSTALPRGVRVSHRNLLHQLANFDHGYNHGPDSVMVSWLPATHDLGLVYGRMMPLFRGFEGVFMPPAAFVQRPIRWLQAVTRFGGTHSPSPNFGLELAVARTSEADRADLDLSSLEVIVNGAEPIRRATEERFVAAFRPHGLGARVVTHAYGMSEATAKITSEPPERSPPRFLRVRQSAYEAGRIELADAAEPGLEIASNGGTVGDTVVRVVDPATRQELGEDRVGEVWVAGRTVAEGYHDAPEATEATFRATTSDGQGPYLRTGDLGFLHEGELYLSGRLKDLVILRGENHHPQDLEWAVEQAHPAVRAGGAIAFAVPTHDGEGLVVVAEMNPQSPPDAVLSALRRDLAAHGVAAETLLLVPPRTVPKTSSGKLQRSRARERFLAGTLPGLGRAHAPRVAPTRADRGDLLKTLNGSSPRRRRKLLTADVAERVGALVGLAPDDVPRDMPLRDLGLDSVTGVELIEGLGRDLGVT